jgi:CRP-like cAMP-binding protein
MNDTRITASRSAQTDASGGNQERNRILRCLSGQDLALLQPRLERVPLPFRKNLQPANRRIKAVYFIEAGLASVVAGNGDAMRRQAEVGVVGFEGMTGLALVHGSLRSPCEIFMQAEGEAQCISADNFCRAIEQSRSLLKCCLWYAHVFGVQSAWTAVANARGKIEERLSRWLLMAQDRLQSDKLLLTHEFLSLMLGVRRAGVTTALQELERRCVIATARGEITVRDRDGLIETANGLYGTPEAEFERLFG